MDKTNQGGTATLDTPTTGIEQMLFRFPAGVTLPPTAVYAGQADVAARRAARRGRAA